MEAPRFRPDSPSFRTFAKATAFGCMIVLAACKGSKNESGAAPAAGSPNETVESAGIESLSKLSLDRIARQAVLIRAKDSPETPGMLLKSGAGSAGSPQYIIVGNTPPDAEKIRFACQATDGSILVASASRELVLPDGLSIYSFASNKKLDFMKPDEARDRGLAYACRLGGQGTIREEERATILKRLATLRGQLGEIRNRSRETTSNFRPDRASREEAMRQNRETAIEQSKVAAEISKLTVQLEMPLDSVSGIEIASAASLEDLERSSSALENTVLVASNGSVHALRHRGKWVGAKDVLAGSSGIPRSVELKISGSQREVRVSCQLHWNLPFGTPECSMVAATTFELESLQGSDIAERLSKVEAKRFSSSKSKSSVSAELEWNGKPTSLWIKVFPTEDPAKPIIDEMVLLDFPGQFSAKWGKSPSPLIKPVDAEPNSPPDLAKAATTADAHGTILDMVAAGDGSMLMVQTDRTPYWAPFDLKTGQFGDSPWKAGPDTLLAAQAGKVYLIDRKTKVVEIWELASKQRTGLQILSLDGDIVAVAAPLFSPASPLLVSTNKTARFVDPVNLDPIASGLDMDSCFIPSAKQDNGLPKIDPPTVRLRASGDGTLYSVEGHEAASKGTRPLMLTITLDPSWIAVVERSYSRVMATRGRHLATYFPDHGGSELQLRTQPSHKPFPSPAGTIRFMDRDGNKSVAELHDAPAVPFESETANGPLPRDRRMYLDSSIGVLVLPDEDQLHVIRLNLPEQPKALPDFVFAGEELEIPLPRGRDHKLILEPAGETSIGEGVARWRVPSDFRPGQVRMNLEWTAELGSTLTSSRECQIVSQVRGPGIVSPGGKTKLSLKRSGVIPDRGQIHGFAGSGQVLLTSSGSHLAAWSLPTCERLFMREEYPGAFFGDADQLYLLNGKGALRSFDLLTGSPLKEASFGNRDQGRKGLAGITTGIACRGPLLAVEQDGMNRYLSLIDRNTLQSKLLDLARESQQLFFIPQFTTNPDGSTIWSFTAAVFRKGNQITVKSFQDSPLLGSPDASGRFIVGRDGILDIRASPPVKTPIADLPGASDSMECELDVSGRYLLLTNRGGQEGNTTVSVRELAKPALEIFKLVIPGESRPRVISGCNKLVCPIAASPPVIGVYDFDIPALAAKLVAGPDPR